MPAPARARAHAPRSTAVPRHHRRVSGPTRPMRPMPAGGVAAGTAVRGRERTSAFERLRALADHRFVDKLLRSRAWIVVVALMLGGIVAMQVSLLKLNAGISRAVEASATLERQNADMQDTIARLSSGERVRAAAAAAGMVAPPAGEVGFLRARGARDDLLAARHMQPPSAQARIVMADGGHDPGAVPVAAATTTAPAPAPTATVTPAPTPAPVSAAPAPDPAAAATSATAPVATPGQG